MFIVSSQLLELNKFNIFLSQVWDNSQFIISPALVSQQNEHFILVQWSLKFLMIYDDMITLTPGSVSS
ncbi:hypothetical protein PHYPO_G00205410 [Pangasianodon hypophthalmus]|uniref:Uncharacterized protein n=1 Tax=Pangasianodon hypophthalmus TaxID=310915 RepID=A0A5N5PDT9_PANHP|nr:hypothetical protein PHYPO_G00205410 [Pangasianodon hypophthalmus]